MSTIRTISNKLINLERPALRDICIEDIAHALSLLCRFAGHVPKMYSVAEHCVRVSRLFRNPEIAFWALMHDATEAYLVDVPSPIKHKPGMRVYRRYEKIMMRAIARKFRMRPRYEPPCIKPVDVMLRKTEQRDLKGKKPLASDTVLSGRIRPWTSRRAKREFLKRFSQLQQLRAA